MTCRKCNFPIPPPLILMREDFFIETEIPNIYDYKCCKCGTKYKLKGFNGEIQILEIDGVVSRSATTNEFRKNIIKYLFY